MVKTFILQLAKKNLNYNSFKLFYFLKQSKGNKVESKIICILKIIYFSHSQRQTKNEQTVYMITAYVFKVIEFIENICCLILTKLHKGHIVPFLRISHFIWDDRKK